MGRESRLKVKAFNYFNWGSRSLFSAPSTSKPKTSPYHLQQQRCNTVRNVWHIVKSHTLYAVPFAKLSASNVSLTKGWPGWVWNVPARNYVPVRPWRYYRTLMFFRKTNNNGLKNKYNIQSTFMWTVSNQGCRIYC